MKIESFLRTIMVFIGLLTGSQLACGEFARGVATVVPTATAVPPTPTPEPTDTATPEPEPVSLDLCSLVTVEEAEAMLGEALSAPPEVGIGNCIYGTATGKSLNIGVAQGDDAKAMSLLSSEIMIMFAGDETAANAFSTLKEQSDSLTVQEVVTEVLSLFAAIGYSTQPIDDLGDLALWSVQSDFNLSSLHLVQDDIYLYINIIGLDEETALETAAPLARQTLERLPLKFTIPTSGRFEYSVTVPAIEITVEAPIPTFTAESPTTEFIEQESYTADCLERPEGSTCLGFDDGYIWLVYDGIQAWQEEDLAGQMVQIAVGFKAKYHHILETNLVKEVPK